MFSRRWLLGGLIAFHWATLSAQSVSSAEGNVYFAEGASSPRRELTKSGRDSEPSLSRDGKLIVFVRGTPDRTTESARGPVELTEIWTIRVDGSDERLRFKGRPSGSSGPPLAAFGSPQFSPDGSRVYFNSVGGVSSTWVNELDLATRGVRRVCVGGLRQVIPTGEYAGYLVVVQHRYFVGEGSYDWAWLIAPSGHEVGPLGDASDASFDQRLRDVIATKRK